MDWTISDTMSVLGGLAVINGLLLIVQKLGPKAIAFTWFPGRTILLIWSILASADETHIRNVLEVCLASHSLAVVFLATFHIFLECLDNTPRLPRYGCASGYWFICWMLSFMAMGGTAFALWYSQTEAMYIGVGIAAALLNAVNLQHAPKKLESASMKFTFSYFLGINIIASGLIFGVHWLLQAGFVTWAGLLTNLPVFSIILFASSSCRETPVAIRTTRQHVFMLAFQTWPSMALVSTLLLVLSVGHVFAVIIASVATIMVIIFQFAVIQHVFKSLYI